MKLFVLLLLAGTLLPVVHALPIAIGIDDTGPKQWMNYIPSAGIVGYPPAGEPRPAVSFSLSHVFTAQR